MQSLSEVSTWKHEQDIQSLIRNSGYQGIRELCKTCFPTELREAEMAVTDSLAQSTDLTDLSLVDGEEEEEEEKDKAEKPRPLF